uniref:Receptor expression-enhancing protein n=1 Tax=Haemonchus contortus TaxID=6289 RepID=A0A7I5E919_HAECO
MTKKTKRNTTPSEGLREAHTDFVSYLYGDRGELYNKHVGTIEKASGLPREKLAYILAGIVAVYLVIGAAAQIVCNIIGIAYPIYASVKAVRTEDTNDDTQWLIYWCVFATFAIIDFFASSIMQWFPFYWLLKAMFLIFLHLPQTMGAHFVFYVYVDPMVTAIDGYFVKRNKQQ